MKLTALLHKELLEYWRTYRGPALAIAFIVLGLLSPAAARYMPELLSSLDTQGMVIQLPEPSVADANLQFVKNMSQMGAIVLILVAMGTVARERERGTTAFTLSKPVSRSAFLLAKGTALLLVTWLALALAGLVHWYYTILLFDSLPLEHWLSMVVLTGVYLTVIAALVFLGSTLARSLPIAASLGIGAYLALSLLGGLPRIGDLLPGKLLDWALSAGNGLPQSAWGSLVVAAVAVLACACLAWLSFRRAEL